jgi:hypothetical protein
MAKKSENSLWITLWITLPFLWITRPNLWITLWITFGPKKVIHRKTDLSTFYPQGYPQAKISQDID